jgi:hypothetical protein
VVLRESMKRSEERKREEFITEPTAVGTESGKHVYI